MITWDELVKLEPELDRLYRKIHAIKDPGGRTFCANARWYGYGGHPSLKAVMVYLVGCEGAARDPRLRTSEAYNIAYTRLYNALPDCRNCMCL
jgi:hypothetical protein